MSCASAVVAPEGPGLDAIRVCACITVWAPDVPADEPPPEGEEGAGGVAFCSLRTSSSGLGRSATWVRRITAISAAIIALGALATSSSAFSNICHRRVSTRIGRASAIWVPRARSSGETVGSSAASGVIFTTDTQWVISARSRNTASGSAPSAYCPDSSVRAAAASPRRIMSNRSSTRPRSASPNIARTCATVVSPAPWLIA